MMALGQALVHLRITLLHLWLGVLLLLSGWSQSAHIQHHSPPEVVIPLRVTGTSKDMGTQNWLSYSLHFGGQRYFVHMKAKKLLVSKHLSVFTYTDQGALLEDQPYVQNDCYYHGYVEGNPESLVALSTCFGGFQGTLQINDMLYEIKPKSLSDTFEHLVYKMDTDETEIHPRRCALTEEEIARQLKLQGRDKSILMQSGYEGWWTHTRFIELALVVDYERFLHRQSNTSKVLQELFIILNEANLVLASLDVDIALLGLEIWNKGNPMLLEEIFPVLREFCKWKRANLNNRIPHDVAHLFAKHNFGIYLGVAYKSTVCNPTFSCGVDSLLGDDFHSIGHIVAHELGHNLGMDHDDHAPCTCGQEECVMTPIENLSTKFSNCSYSVLVKIDATKSCILSAPNVADILPLKHCGNGMVEDGEECDCGSLKMCKNDPCCQLGCTLKSGARCASGLCCKNCQFMPSGTVCREQGNVCDLPEWCNGTSQDCPEDVYLQDGSPCLGMGFCYEKRCNIHDEQCRQIFGINARSASRSCYREMNTRGDRFGNCGISRDTYIKCNSSDILCGRIQCDNVAEIPFLREHSTVHRTQFNEFTCWGIDYHSGMSIPDIGDVKDGTECSPLHVCMNRKCVHKSVWTSDCSPNTCNMKGVCNNKHHCHCNFGSGPPNCLINGSGGSVDSGPPPETNEGLARSYFNLLFWIPFWVLFLCLLVLLWKRHTASKKEGEAPTSV
ncbi:disintegrin and metalloproteinase domain-containing protein 25-like [Castor canadensis]|uniref:Disintegrin and metalloproteinase domain-containing protein 25-like n=1 Tax=Castor canadensis TaxID=51338 RepID=A0AC58KXD1_CASCN